MCRIDVRGGEGRKRTLRAINQRLMALSGKKKFRRQARSLVWGDSTVWGGGGYN